MKVEEKNQRAEFQLQLGLDVLRADIVCPRAKWWWEKHGSTK